MRLKIILGRQGAKTKGFGDVLQGGVAGSNSFWVGDVGDDPLHGRGHWGFQQKVAIWITGRYPLQFLVVPTFVDGNSGGWV